MKKLTHDEHVARAMLLGLRYHHGNGEPFYYKMDTYGTPEIGSMLDADTMEPLMEMKEVPWAVRPIPYPLHPRGRTASDKLFKDWTNGELP